jgi:hypothetical protein
VKNQPPNGPAAKKFQLVINLKTGEALGPVRPGSIKPEPAHRRRRQARGAGTQGCGEAQPRRFRTHVRDSVVIIVAMHAAY